MTWTQQESSVIQNLSGHQNWKLAGRSGSEIVSRVIFVLPIIHAIFETPSFRFFLEKYVTRYGGTSSAQADWSQIIKGLKLGFPLMQGCVTPPHFYAAISATPQGMTCACPLSFAYNQQKQKHPSSLLVSVINKESAPSPLFLPRRNPAQDQIPTA